MATALPIMDAHLGLGLKEVTVRHVLVADRPALLEWYTSQLGYARERAEALLWGRGHAIREEAVDINNDLNLRLAVLARFRLGVVYYLRRMHDKAIAQLEHVLRLDPSNQEAREYLERARRGAGAVVRGASVRQSRASPT